MAALAIRLSSGSSSRASRLVALTQSSRIRSRYVHFRKEVPYPIEGGLGNFLPPPALKMLAVDYQQGLLDRLNQETKDTEQENKSVVQTLIDASADPDKVFMFNYASEALNNSFFFDSLKPPPPDATSHEYAISDMLSSRMRFQFGSFEDLKSIFSAAALGMFSPGWLWLVCDKKGELAVIPTFGTGTLIVRSRIDQLEEHVLGAPVVQTTQRSRPGFSPAQALGYHGRPPASTEASAPDASSGPTSPTSGISHAAPPLHPSTPSRTFSASSAAWKQDYVPSSLHAPPQLHAYKNAKEWADEKSRYGDEVFPLLCLSVHERAWVGAGYGVWGKEEYLKRFWTVVDWNKVSKLYAKWYQPDKGVHLVD